MSDGRKLAGQQFDLSRNMVLRFTERDHDYSGTTLARITGLEGQAATDITPKDGAAAKVRVWDLTANQALLDAEVISYIDTINLSGDLPSILTGVTVAFNSNSGNGASNHPTSEQEFLSAGTSASASLNPRSSAQASASIIPDIAPTILDPFYPNVPVSVYLFYMTDTTTLATLLSRLSTLVGSPVLAWPRFRPVSHTFSLFGQQVSISQSADTSVTASISSTNYNFNSVKGSGYSTETGVSVRTVTIRPTIHGALSFPISAQDATASVDVEASARAIVGTYNGASFTLGPVINDPIGYSRDVTGWIYPSAVPATSPAAIPTSGFYLHSLSVGDTFLDRIAVRATVVDFSLLA